jgi:hypothetical protein
VVVPVNSFHVVLMVNVALIALITVVLALVATDLNTHGRLATAKSS